MTYALQPPNDIGLECAVLGAILIEQKAFMEVSFLSPEMFYKPAHEVIYNSMIKLNAKGDPIDLLSVTDELRKSGELTGIGGAYYLSELTNTIASTANIENHARKIIEHYMKRQVSKICRSLDRDANDQTVDVFDLLDLATKQIYDLSNCVNSGTIKSTHEIKAQIEKEIIEIKSGLKMPGIIPTCLSNIKLQTGTVTVIGAKPGTGKTAFITSAATVQANAGYNVGIKSIEMTDTKLTARIIQQELGISAKRLVHGDIDDDQYDKLKDVKIPQNIFIDATARVTAGNIRNQLVAFIVKYKCKVLYIDYFQKIILTEKRSVADNQYELLETICQVAKEYDVAICVLSQLSRGGDDDTDWLEKLRGGGIEQGASEVYIFIDKYKKQNEDAQWTQIPIDRRGQLKYDCVKNRDDNYLGGMIYFDKPHQKMVDWEKKPEQFESGTFAENVNSNYNTRKDLF